MNPVKRKKSTLDDFCEIVQRLRAEDGCPWDRKQTHESLRMCMIEEAYECVEAIRLLSDTGSASNLQEELGDMLLQVVMHAQIASEEQLFDINDVIDGICEKMIRRHPHVFDSLNVENPSQVSVNWEEIKKQEKNTYSQFYEDEFDQVPKAFPALIRAQKILKKAAQKQIEFSKEQNLEQIKNSLDGLQTGSEREYTKEAQKQIGAALFHIADLAKKYHVTSEDALREYTEQFIKEARNTKQTDMSAPADPA